MSDTTRDPLRIYGKVRAVPEDAKKKIGGGKLKGKTDINPVWRIKVLTELFGPCGTGWGYIIDRQWTETGAAGEVAAFCNIRLWYVDGEERGEVFGTGGSMLVNTENGKLATNDEAFKMALTDAISVAAKALGVAADVYWEADATKYTAKPETSVKCPVCGKNIRPVKNGGELKAPQQVLESLGMCAECYRKKGRA